MSEEEYRHIFVKKLSYYMSEYGKNQMDLMNDLGLSSSTVSSWCTGKKLPRMGKIQMLADYFGIEKSDLIEEKSSTDPEPTYTLTPKEEVLVSDFRTLNDQGQDYILQTMDMVKDKYKKSADVSGMEKIG